MQGAARVPKITLWRQRYNPPALTLGGLPDGSWMRAGLQKDHAILRSLEISALPLILLRREKG